MKKWLLLAMTGTALALVGCKSGIDVPVSYSDLHGQNKTIQADLHIEIPACKAPNTGLDSAHLLEAKQTAGFIIEGAKFKNCQQDGFTDFAHFSVPIQIGKESLYPEKGLSIALYQDAYILLCISRC